MLFAHVIGACVLLGTGAGIAFFMVLAQRGNDPNKIVPVAQIVVIADFVFTATAAIAQPITGLWLSWYQGWSISDGWVLWAICLYVVVGVFWVPVVWIQAQLRDLAIKAQKTGMPLSVRYHRLYAIWFACGFPAFAAVLAIVWLMLTKPVL